MADQQHDLITLFYLSFASDIALLSGRDLTDSTVSPSDPLIINDLTGAPLFADYDVVDRTGSKLGTIRSSARSTQLPLIDSILIGDQWFDPPAAVDKAKQSASTLAIGPIIDVTLVCYGYPRIGVLVKCQTANGPHSLVYDAAVGVLVKQWDGPFVAAPEAGPGGIPEGQPFYSILADVPEAGIEVVTPAQSQWNQLQSVLSVVKTPLRLASRLHPHPMDYNNPLDFNKLSFAFGEIRDAEYLRADPAVGAPTVRFAIRGSLLPATLFSQSTPVFCAVATAEMMLAFIGVAKDQTQISTAMATAAAGTTNANFLTGLKSLSAGAVTGVFVDSPAFTDCVTAMENLLPAKSGIPGHARLLRGWREYVFFDDSGNVLSKEQFLVINDPYPMTTGQLVLESFVKPIPNYYTNLITMQKGV